MSDDDTRELPPVEPPAEDGPEATAEAPEATAEVAAAQGADATAGTTEKDETMTIEPATPEPPKAEEATIPLPRADEATIPLPRADEATAPLPKADDATAPLPRIQTPPPAAPPADAYAAATGHIRVMSAPAPVAPELARHLGLRVGTVVWGLVVTAVAVGLLSIAWGAHLDAELAFIVLLGAAGVALLVGSLVGMRRSRTRMEGRG
jgi:hypothetical protein